MENKVLIGTSGWGYDEWVGPFYPKGLEKKDYLSYYSELFYTNEINTTFYNIPSIWVVKNWVNKTPANFLFTAKLPQTVTHGCKLDIDNRTCLEDLTRFLYSMSPLIESNKLLGLLIQLPPSFEKKKHFENLREFIENWPTDRSENEYHLIVEFRHESWMSDEVFHYLKRENLTYCAVLEPKLPPRMDVTNKKFAYIRFHGYGKEIWFDYFFNEGEIKKWAVSVKQVIQKADQVGIYFNNHFSGYAVKNSLMMMDELGIQPRKNPGEISVFDIKKKSGTVARGQKGLDQFLR